MSTTDPLTVEQQNSKKRKKKQNSTDTVVSKQKSMKQKRLEHVTEPRGQPEEGPEDEQTLHFDEMGLDARLVKAIADLGWKEPTLIQEKAIPLAIKERKDILGRGRTGCGKTGAYLIPIIHLILQGKKNNPSQQTKTRALVIAPSKELCRQIEKHTMDLTKYCMDKVTALEVGSVQSSELKLLLSSTYDIIIGTPSRLLEKIKNNSLGSLNESLEFVVIDEADLIFSFGYEKEMEDLLSRIQPPQDGCKRQSFLMSATLDTDVAALKQLCLKNPVSLRLEEPDLPESGRLTQYVIRCEEQEKYILLNALFKLNLIRGRTIIFTNGVDKCYRLKLFLEQFDIRACILNPELPIESRIHVVDEFNRGLYSIIIASDDKSTVDPSGRGGGKMKKKKKEENGVKFDREFGVSRGIDFQFVSNVINFDFPDSVTSYIHRVGRTGRGARDAATGTALSFVKVAENNRFELVKETLGSGADFKPYQFKMDELDAFTYRSRDALKAVTSAAVREARVREIKRQLLNSEKLKAFFDAHPKDYHLLRSDSELHPIRRQQHLKHMPDYMIPATLRAVAKGGKSNHEVPLTVVPNQFKTRKSKSNKTKQGNNPLKTFSLSLKRNK